MIDNGTKKKAGTHQGMLLIEVVFSLHMISAITSGWWIQALMQDTVERCENNNLLLIEMWVKLKNVFEQQGAYSK